MISYHESQASREAKAKRADEILAAHEAADRAAENALTLRGVGQAAPHETPDEFLRRVGYKF